VIKTLEGMFKRNDALSCFLTAHVDDVLAVILQNMEAKRVLVPSKDLFLSMKCVVSAEKLAERLIKLIDKEEN
jgi:hypothetical protein